MTLAAGGRGLCATGIRTFISALEQVSANLVDEIEHFFVSYNEIKGKRFTPLGRSGADRARQLVEDALERVRR